MMAATGEDDAPMKPAFQRGMSRAAKKRAKKRKKEQQVSENESRHDRVDEPTEVDDEGADPHAELGRKLDKAELPSTGSDAKKNERTHLLEEDSNIVPMESSSGTDDDDLIHCLISKLTPTQILLLEDVPDETVVSHEEVGVNCSELLHDDQVTSRHRARALLQSLLENTVTLSEFYRSYWETKPLLVVAKNKARFQNLYLTLPELRQMLKTQPFYYGKDLNVTRYDEAPDGVKRRITLDPVKDNPSLGGQDEDDFVLVDSKDVWTNYDDAGCTIRLLCPHQNCDSLHAALSTLELEWGCMVGANVYLTPPRASQGFAPHYDDIEAFVLQLEGYKHWKVYAPLNKAETLPRTSSNDFTEQDLEGIEPVLDVVLGPGDLLYMPRGWIHQACTLDDVEHRNHHSLHLTISAMQHWSWAEFMDLLMPEAVEAVATSDRTTSLREGLPVRFLDYMGAIHDDSNDEELPEGLKQLADIAQKEQEKDDEDASDHTMHVRALREQFREEAKKRIMRVSKQALSMLDAACDQIGKRFLSDRQPPAFTPTEAELTSENRSENGGRIWPNTLVRLARPGIARIALEDGKVILYHCVDNSRVYQGNPLSPMEFEMDDAPALEMLLETVEPHWIQVKDLLHDDIEDKMELTQALYDEGILAMLQTDKPDRTIQVK